MGSAAECIAERLRCRNQIVDRAATVTVNVHANKHLFTDVAPGAVLGEQSASLTDTALKRQQDDMEHMQEELGETERQFHELMALFIENEERQRRIGNASALRFTDELLSASKVADAQDEFDNEGAESDEQGSELSYEPDEYDLEDED